MNKGLGRVGSVSSAVPRLLLPREHGAWAMLLLPFLSAVMLAREFEWELLPAAVVVVGVFLMREALVALWRRGRDALAGRRSLRVFVPPVALSAALLLWRLPFWPLAAMGAAAAVLTAVSTHFIVQNRRRSLLLQLASAAGLTASALVAWLAVRPEFEPVVGWLWALQFLHSGAALLAVHARLEARIASRGNVEATPMKRRARAAQILVLAAGGACVAIGRPGVGLALLFSGGIHTADLARLRRPAFVQTPLPRVGLRELAVSVVFSALVVAGLW